MMHLMSLKNFVPLAALARNDLGSEHVSPCVGSNGVRPWRRMRVMVVGPNLCKEILPTTLCHHLTLAIAGTTAIVVLIIQFDERGLILLKEPL